MRMSAVATAPAGACRSSAAAVGGSVGGGVGEPEAVGRTETSIVFTKMTEIFLMIVIVFFDYFFF